MIHQMQLQPEPFRMIRSGRKTIELRLYDEKRQRIRPGDSIEFTCIEGHEPSYTARVKAIHLYDDFRALYRSLPLLLCGYTRENIARADYRDMEAYYSPAQQRQYGVVGIELESPRRNDPLTRASRFLSMVLRHRPQAAGIALDRFGWAEVEPLLRGMPSSHALTREQLEAIVRDDEKQRYAFNDDHTKIRANQGHSVPVEVELTECQPPEVLYHGTAEVHRNAILQKGLLSGSRLYVHLSPDVETAKMVGLRHGTPVVFTVDSGAMYRDGIPFYRSANGVWLTHYVPTNYLTPL